MKNKIFALIFCMIFLVGTVSALDFSIDNYKVFEDIGSYGRINVWDKGQIGADKKLIEYELLENTDQCLINCYAEGTAILHTNGKLFSDLNFKDIKGKSVSLKKSNIFIWTTENYEIDINDYKEVCEIINNNGTLKSICNQELIGMHKETRTRDVWKEYNFENLKAGDYKWRIEGTKKTYEEIDWIGTGFGEDLTEWAWWNEDWDNKKLITITGNNGDLVYLNLSYSNVSSAQADFDDIRFINSAEDTEFGYTLQDYTSSNSARFKVNATGNTSFYIYYNNAGVSTTSDASNLYGTGLLSYWSFDGNGTTDFLGIRNLTANGDPTQINSGCKFGNCYVYDGNDYLGGSDAGLPTGSNTATMCAWMNSSNIAASRHSFGYGSYSSNAMRNLGTLVTTGAGYFTQHGGSVSNGVLSLNNWHLFCASNSGNTWQLWLNGVAENSGDATTSTALNSLSIGKITQDLSGYWLGAIDDVMIWDRELSAGEHLAYYNTTIPTFTLGAEEEAISINTIQSYPIDNFNTVDNTVGIGCNFSGLNQNLTDVTVLVYDSSDNLDYTNTESGLSLTSYNKTWTTTTLTDDIYLWACLGEGTFTSKYAGNRTFTIDTTAPIINITSPISIINYHLSGNNLTLNWSVSDSHLESCWYNQNGTNLSVTCSDNSTQFIVTENSNKNLTFYANDSFGNEDTNFISWNYKIFENDRTFNSLIYETAFESYIINITSNSNLTGVNLDYNGTEYPMSSSGGLWTYSRDIPENIVGNKSVNFNFDYDGASIVSTKIGYQSIDETIFSLCNATLSQKYYNITFKDESDNSRMYASIPTSTFTYWLGSGTQTKTYSLINNTANYEYPFCFTPINRNVSVNMEIQFKNETNYPQRIYEPATLLLSNLTTNKTLYLLSTIDGLYVTYQVLDSIGDKISGVEVSASRVLDGEDYVIATGTTDSSGIVTFWINPDFQHAITFAKTGYISYSLEHFPTQQSYTITLASSSGTDVTNYIRGITYTIKPQNSFLEYGQIYEFNITLNSTYWDLDSFGFRMYGDEVLINSNSSTSSTGSFLSLNLNTSSYEHLYMNYYWIINGSLTNATNKGWNIFNYGNGTDWSIQNFFDDLSSFLGDDENGIFGLSNDENNGSLGMIIFLFIVLGVGMCSYKFSITSPIAISGILFALVFFFDVGLNLINVTLFGAIPHFPTIFIGLIFVGLIIREVTR